ncbi:MAG: hypothetical protein GEU78_01065 [Actinobacteria bacterium]|nr:hypothetical protein [Actinomycetota bacterium]
MGLLSTGLCGALLAVTLVGCSGSSGSVAEGDALETGADVEVDLRGPAGFAPGQEFIDVLPTARNPFRDPLRIVSVEPVRDGPSRIGRVVEVLLGPIDLPGRPNITMTRYRTDPPVWWRGPLHGCAVQETREVGDFIYGHLFPERTEDLNPPPG